MISIIIDDTLPGWSCRQKVPTNIIPTPHIHDVYVLQLVMEFFQLYTVSLLCDHQILTKDAVTVSVEAVIYYRISDASAVVNQLENHRFVKPIRGKTLNTQPQLSQLFLKKYICTKGHSNHIFMYLLHPETGSLYSCWTEDLFYTQLVTNFSLAPECPLDTHLH